MSGGSRIFLRVDYMKNLAKLLAIVFIGAALPASAFGVDWKAYPDSIKAGNIIVNAGVGVGTPLYGKMTIPPLVVNVDYALPMGGIPFTLGGFFVFNQSTFEEEWIGASSRYGYIHTYTGTAFGARLAYHPNFEVKNLDAYATFALGYYLYGATTKYTGEWLVSKSKPANYDTIYFGFNLGARYFFTPVVGVWGELGYSALSYITAGISVKF
jgi:hypothetical protein